MLPLAYGRMHVMLKPRLENYQLSVLGWQFWKDVVLKAH